MRRMRSAVAVGLLFSVLPLVGCLRDDVGERCDVGVADPRDPHTVINLHAIDCESGVCIKYLAGASGARCTAPCNDDSDCPGATAGCPKFVCRIGGAVIGASCCKFCVCDTDANTNDPEERFCRAKAAKCPKT